MRSIRTRTTALVALCLAFGACNDEPPLPPGFGAIQLAASSGDPHDVAQFEFRIIEDGTGDCNTGTVIASSVVPMNAQLLLADDLFVLPPETYLVCALPQQTGGAPSDECAEASDNALVQDGQTTSVALVSPCTGGGNGAIDVTVSLEDYPIITDIDIAPSKYFEVCDEVTLTATLDDPGSDGFNSIAWTVESTPAGASPALSTADQLSTIFTADTVGAYDLKLTVDDQLGGVQSLTFPMQALPCTQGGDVSWLTAPDPATSTGNNRVIGVATDGAGNTIAAGWFSSAIDWGLGSPPSSGTSTGMMVKLDTSGATLWSSSFSSGVARVDAVSTDSADNILIAGTASAADLDLGGACAVDVADGTQRLFMAKLDPAGSCLWSAVVRADANHFLRGFAVDPSTGDAVLAAVYNGSASTPEAVLPAGSGYYLKRDGATGAAVWAQSAEQAALRDVAVNPATGEVLLVGTTSDATSTFSNDGVVTPLTITNGSTGDEAFVIGFDGANGGYAWHHAAVSASGASNVRGVGSGPNGDVVVLGNATADVDLGAGAVSLPSTSEYVAVYDAAGTLRWHYLHDAFFTDALVSAGGRIVVAGSFSGVVDFGFGLIGSSSNDAIVVGFSSTGTPLWNTAGGSSWIDGVHGIAQAPDGSLRIGGSYGGYNSSAFTLGSESAQSHNAIASWVASLKY